MTASHYAPDTLPAPARWQDKAACQGQELDVFFPKPRDAAALAAAKAFCFQSACPVRLACLAAALREEGGVFVALRHGVRGGYTPVERYRLRQRQRARGEQAAA